jgi:hypothetical protein
MMAHQARPRSTARAMPASHLARAAALARMAEMIATRDHMALASRAPGDVRHDGLGVVVTLEKREHGYVTATEHFLIEDALRVPVLRNANAFVRLDDVLGYLDTLGFAPSEIANAVDEAPKSSQPIEPAQKPHSIVSSHALIGLGVGLIATMPTDVAADSTLRPATTKPRIRTATEDLADPEVLEGALRAFETHVDDRLEWAMDSIERTVRALGRVLVALDSKVDTLVEKPASPTFAPPLRRKANRPARFVRKS